MDFVATRGEILRNVRGLDRLSRSASQSERKYHHDRIRRGHSFVWTIRNGRRVFGPSRFVGYKNNNAARHDRNEEKSGWETNRAISEILNAPRVSRALEADFKKYCSRHGIEPEDRRRRYWLDGV
jgi:hypothetical protein